MILFQVCQLCNIYQLPVVLLKYVGITQLWAGGQRGTTFKYQVTKKSFKPNMPSILSIPLLSPSFSYF
jgi:hypothetical protein